MKLMIKKLLAACLSRAGTCCPPGWLEDVVSMRLSSYLLDERILPRRAVSRPLRGTDVAVLCNPYIATHKRLFWCGRLEQKAIESYIRRELLPGDTFIDVGSNYGHLSILASCLIKPSGRVIGFEANNHLAKTLTDHLQAQGIENVQVHGFGLGDAEIADELLVDPKLPGQSFVRGTVREPDQDHSQVVACVIRMGDRVLEQQDLPGKVCLKVDVEGYEIPVLRGLRQSLLKRIHHAIIEVTPQWIGGAAGVRELLGIMGDAGFKAYQLRGDGRLGDEWRAELIDRQTDVIFRKE
jgi:FkbM family methyltransferase